MTMKSAGKIQNRRGKRIFTVTFCACSSARQADASDLASSRTVVATVADAASPVAIVPLPAIAGRSYVSPPATLAVYHLVRA